MIDSALPAVPKPVKSPTSKAWRLLASALDPRAYLHAFRLLNYYNYSHVTPRRALTLGAGVALSPTISFSHAARISIGARSHIGTRCMLWAGPERGRIDIGETCLFGPGVFVTAATYRFRDGSPVTQQPMTEAHVTVGKDVWIGANAVILPGAQIGDSAIIGAGAIIRGPVAPGAIIAGPTSTELGHRFHQEEQAA
jgi:acetyltransferase-like isoleucine patch superfamily enzyme